MRVVIVCFVWLIILFVCASVYRYAVAPYQESVAKQKEEQAKEDLLKTTSSTSRYQDNVTINLDSFSGYATIRSAEFHSALGNFGIGLNLVDDHADYDRRLQDLRDGKCEFATFTIDALIKASEKIGEIPGVIIFVIDESRGADAAIGVQRMIGNVDSLNNQNTKFVLVPDSPSETLARVMMSYFNLNQLGNDPFIKVNSAKDLYEMYRKHKVVDPYIFVTWEPQVTKMAENPDYKIIVDSSKFRGYIVDVMVVSRSFLAKNPHIVQNVTKSYFTALFAHQRNLPDLLQKDSIEIGEPLKEDLAKALSEKIIFRNTKENYVQFGMDVANLQHIEDMIGNITKILLKTNGLKKDPTGGQPNQLYYDRVLKSLKEENFFPGSNLELIRDDDKLAALTDEDWAKLEPVGTLEVSDLVFARGKSTLTTGSKATLDELAKKLQDTPQFYLIVTGNSGIAGDLEANKKLASERAQSTKDYLVSVGMSAARIRTVAGTPKEGQTTVTFVVGQMPY